MRLIRAFGEEEREASRFASQTNRYRKQVIRTQRLLVAHQPAHRDLLRVAGHPDHLGRQQARPHRTFAPLAPEAIIVFLMAALKLTSPLKTISLVSRRSWR